MRVHTFLHRLGSPPDGLPTALDSPRTLVLVFGAPEAANSPVALAPLSEAFPRSVLFGCSTAGEIHHQQLFDGTIVGAVCQFEHTDLAVAVAEIDHTTDSERAASRIARQLDRPGLRGLLVVSDGLGVDGSALARGFNAVLPPGVVVTGGLAGDGPRFERTWVVHDGRPAPRIVAALAFYGPVCTIGYGSKGGWDRFGPERLVTRAEGNVLYELDGKPALNLYKTYLGTRATQLPASAMLFPLSLRPATDDGDRVVRAALGIDEAARSLTFAGEIPQGRFVQFMRANPERLVQAASQAGHLAQAPHAPGRPTLAVAISSIGRRLVLGERTEEEIEATLGALPPGTAQVGFYAYGELSPSGTGACDLHSQTMTLTTISEAA